MEREYALRYRDLYNRHWWWRAREEFLLERLTRDAGGRENLRILDVGCGDALFFDELDRFGYVEGIEPDADIVTDGPWRSRVYVGDLTSHPFSEVYDWILMLDVLEHVAEPEPFLAAARARLSPAGSLYVTVPAFEGLWSSHDETNRHFARYTRSSLTTLLDRMGFEAVKVRYFYHWLAPVKLLAKVYESVSEREAQPESVPPGPINRLAYWLAKVEHRLPLVDHIPFGTSVYGHFRLSEG